MDFFRDQVNGLAVAAPLHAKPSTATQISADAASKRPRINPYKRFIGSFLPNWLLCRREVSAGAKLCYARLAQYAGKGGFCHPKQSLLAHELGVDKRTARRHLSELEGFGLIESEQQGLRRSNRYFFLDHAWMHEDSPTTPELVSTPPNPPSGQGAKLSGQERTNLSGPIVGRESIEENQYPLIPLPGECVSNQQHSRNNSDQAEAVYEAYPVKVGKPVALPQIRTAIQKHGFDFVLDRTRLFAQTYAGDRRFIPNPSTFFKEERYSDDPSTWKRGSEGARKNVKAELDSIRSELQWQRDPARVRELRDRRDALT